ncbi:hypothetical protein [Nonlabens sp. Asnod2-A12]|uniref:hypothetical protein n=1 Tax=Nonlabens sp. Asnod2-A12 TaxID=3160578 RepID=UPI00386B76CD
MGTKKEIGSVIKNQLDSLNVTPSEQLWDRLEESLQEKKKRRILPFWFWYGTVGTLLIGILLGGSFYHFSSVYNSKHEVSSKETNVESSISEKQTLENEDPDYLLKETTDNNLNESNHLPGVSDSYNDAIAISMDDDVDKKANTDAASYSQNNSNSYSRSSAPIATNSSIAMSIHEDQNEYNQPNIDQNDSDILKEDLNTKRDFSDIENALILKNSTETEGAVEDSLSVNQKEKQKKKRKRNKKERKKDTITKPYVSPWSVSVSGIVNSYDNFGKTSLIDNRLDGNQVNRDTNFNYGLAFHYSPQDSKHTLRVGINYVKYGQTTQLENTSINLERLQYVSYKADPTVVSVYLSTATDIDIFQEFTYIEFPLQLRYSLYKKKVDFGLMVGVQSRVLLEDSITFKSNVGDLEVGESNTLFDFGVSAHLSLPARFKLYKKFYFNVEPSIYYHVKPYEADNISTPSEFRLTTSLEYKF